MAVFLFTGDDESLLIKAVLDLVTQLVGAGDRSLMVDDYDCAAEGFEVRTVVDAAQTMPFLTDKRVVVARNVTKLDAEATAAVVAYLQDPLDSTELVMSATGKPSKAMAEALKTARATITSTAAPNRGRERAQWIDEQLAAAGLALDASAKQAVAVWLGEDAGRLPPVLEILSSTYERGRRLSAGDVAPFLGQAGDVPPWDLTDAIDSGDTTKSLLLLRRMMHAGDRHPLQVMSTLIAHYQKVLQLDGSGANSENAAMALLGVKSGFQASKSLKLQRQLGEQGTRRAMQLLATADLDLRGQRDLDPELVIEVLVARLSKLGGRR